jgi:hypothetical protein
MYLGHFTINIVQEVNLPNKITRELSAICHDKKKKMADNWNKYDLLSWARSIKQVPTSGP